jgi:hypothetical protein
MTKCLKSPFEITDENYTNVRKNNLEKLIKRYQTLTQKLIEMEATQNTQQNSQQINDLNTQIYTLQNTLFENNDTSLTRLSQQKINIKKKENSSNINKTVISAQNQVLQNNDSIIGLANKQFKESEEKKSNIDRTFSFLSIFILIVLVVSIVLIILHKDVIDDGIYSSISPSSLASASASASITSSISNSV